MVSVLQENDLCPGGLGAVYPGSPHHVMPPHFHPQLEFVIVRQGQLLEQVGASTHIVPPRHLIWHLPGVAHALLAVSSHHEFRVVHLEELVAARAPRGRFGAFEKWVGELAMLIAGRPLVELRSEHFDALWDDCAAAETQGFAPSPKLAARLLDVALAATRADHDERRANSFAELAVCLLLEEPELSRHELCRRLDLSEGYFSRCFAQELGLSFRQQRARTRVLRFCTLATREPHNFLSAALASGFGSYSQAYRVFVEVAGIAPRDYLHNGGRQARSAQRGDRCLVL